MSLPSLMYCRGAAPGLIMTVIIEPVIFHCIPRQGLSPSMRVCTAMAAPGALPWSSCRFEECACVGKPIMLPLFPGPQTLDPDIVIQFEFFCAKVRCKGRHFACVAYFQPPIRADEALGQ